MSVGIEKILEIDCQDKDIGLKFGHYKPLAELINKFQFKRVIEIGCAYGNLAEHLLENTGIEILYSIDPYAAYCQMPCIQDAEDYELLFRHVVEKMYPRYEGRFDLMRDSSDSAVRWFNPKSFDLVFIDGDHSYEAVKTDIEKYSIIIRPGGILSGHDITVFQGVDMAVNEYQKNTGKELNVLPGNIWYFNM